MKSIPTTDRPVPRRWARRALAAIAVLCATLAQADVMKIGAGIELHYNALPSVDIPAQVMKDYGLKRSKNLGMLNISLVSLSADPVGGPPLRQGIRAQEIACTATNLNRQQRNLEIKVVKSGEAVYHLALFPIENQDEIKFLCSIEIPEAAGDGSLTEDGHSLTLDFSKSFYVE